jgi:hypothetical protein
LEKIVTSGLKEFIPPALQENMEFLEKTEIFLDPQNEKDICKNLGFSQEPVYCFFRSERQE